MDDILGLSGQFALVMGGGRGIGRESALLLARAGAHVAVGDIDRGRSEAVAKEIAELGVRSIAIVGDVRVPLDVQRMVDEAAEFAEHRLEILINMIGLASWTSVMDLDDETWDHDINMNLRHHLYVSRAVAKKMIEAGVQGRIAVIASVDAFYASTNHPAYGVAKAGLVSLVKTMAEEWGEYGIRVNAVAPDATLTPRVVAALRDSGIDPNIGRPQPHRPLQRWATPAEQAGPLVFLVSNLSSYVSGQTLIVDGGLFSLCAGRESGIVPMPARP
jgi:NAD(P)-dependent dehydrogenase (short-subunit alcohol dehydrogenase family)